MDIGLKNARHLSTSKCCQTKNLQPLTFPLFPQFRPREQNTRNMMANVCPKSEEFSLPPNEVPVAVNEAKVPDGDCNLSDKTKRRNLIRRSFSDSATHGLFPGEECKSPDQLSKYTARIGMAKHKSDSDLRRTNILHGAQQTFISKKGVFCSKINRLTLQRVQLVPRICKTSK